MRPPLFFGRLLFTIAQIVNRFIPILNTPRTRVAVILNDSEILLVKNWMGRQQWTLPGGGVKRGEAPEQGAARELLEETGLVVDPAELIFLGHVMDSGLPRVALAYRINLNDSDSAATIPAGARYEITDLGWHPLNNLPMDRLGLVDQALAQP
jgi:ADP-ribose pyrophosphatase YjhB (NUDIX family)